MKTYKVLIIDDNPQYLDALINKLKREHFEVVIQETAKKACKYLELGGQADIILLDLVLPDAYGLDLIPFIRKLCQAPIIIISSLGDSDVMSEALNAGGFVYLKKDIDPNHDSHEAFRIDPSVGVAQIRQILKNLTVEKTTFSFINKITYLNNTDLRLGDADYLRFKFLHDNHNTPQYRKDILEQFRHLTGGNWNEDADYNLDIVSQHINIIRKKILDVAPGFRPIATIQPQQYQFIGQL